MRLRVHHPLFAGFVGVIGLLVVLIVLIIGSGLRTELDAIFQDDLERQLNLARVILERTPDPDADSIARLITERIGNRVTIIDTAGVVLAESFLEPALLPEVENHLQRPEVQAVLAGDTTAFAQRTSSTVGILLLYGARMAELDGERVILRIAAPRTDLDGAIDDVQRTVAATGILVLLLSLAVAYWLSRAFTAPIIGLVDRAGRLAQGDFAHRVPRSRVAELAELGVAFNRLSDELQARLSELSSERNEMQTVLDSMAEGVIAVTEDARVMRANRTARALLGLDEVPPFAPVGTVVRNPALRDALQRSVEEDAPSAEIELGGRSILLASRMLDRGGAVTTLLDITELRRLEQVRRDFVANASHEIKTPLTAIRGFAETLVEDDPPEDLRRQFAGSIRANTLRLQRLVDDLLDLSRLEAGGWSAARTPVEVDAVIREAWALTTEAKGESRDFELDGSARVVGDREGMVQILRNLLENAVRHTEADGRIQVSVRVLEAEGMASIEVTDDGEGIPARSLPRIFERFYRADSSRARDFGGTGLGLAIVKHLVSAMGGEVSASSELGRGTTIGFTIPMATSREG